MRNDGDVYKRQRRQGPRVRAADLLDHPPGTGRRGLPACGSFAEIEHAQQRLSRRRALEGQQARRGVEQAQAGAAQCGAALAQSDQAAREIQLRLGILLLAIHRKGGPLVNPAFAPVAIPVSYTHLFQWIAAAAARCGRKPTAKNHAASTPRRNHDRRARRLARMPRNASRARLSPR